MGNKCCKCKSSAYSSVNGTVRSFSSHNFSVGRLSGNHAITFGTSTNGDSLTTLTMKSSNDDSDVGRDYRGGSLSTVGQEDPIPIFLRRLNDLNVRVGTRTRFLIELDDPTGVQVRWYHNNVEAYSDRYQYIHEGGFYCLDIVPVTLEDEGLWVCTAQNYAGKTSTAAHISLTVPKAFKRPIFVEPLKAVLTQRGIVSLECKVIGVPTPKLRWYKDDKEIKAGDIFALTANSSDDCLGVYTCEATNVMGTALSTSKIQVAHTRADGEWNADSLIPYGPPPKFVKSLKDVTGKVGNVLFLECQVEVPPWPQSVGWYNNLGMVNEGPLYHLLSDNLGMYGVEIKSLRADHNSTWKCVVTSAMGVKAVTSCLITVTYPKNYRIPRFLESLRAIMTDEGLVSFECKVIGYPTPELFWFKDGNQLQPGDVYELTGSKSLGTYCCVARNCMGEASSLAELTVEDIQSQLNESEKLQLTSNTQPPRFLLGLKSTEASINEPLVFKVKVVTESTPTITWYKEDEELSESSRYQFFSEKDGTFILNIIPLEIEDQAEWKCVAVNKYGQTVTSCFLKLNIPKNFKPPKFLDELKIAFSNEGSVNLECKVIGVPQPQLKWLKDGQELNPGDMHKIISGQSGTCCLGTYTCQAHNCMGTVSSSATLLTMEDKSTVKSAATEEYLSVENPLIRNESLSTIPEERTSQMEKSYTIEEPADISFSFDGKEVTVSLYETPDLTHDEALQIIEMYADELSENISEDNVVDLPSLRIVKESSISGPIMMEALVIDVPVDFCHQQIISDTEFDGVSLTEDTTLEKNEKSDSVCENSLEFYSDHLSSSNSKRDIFFSASENSPRQSSLILKPKSEDDGHPSFHTPKLFMSNSDDQILTQLNLNEKIHTPKTFQNIIEKLVRSESNNTEEEVSETLAEMENELPLVHDSHNAAEILTQFGEDGQYSTNLNTTRNKAISTTQLSSEEDDILKIISRPNVNEFLKYMKIILEGTMVKLHAHESFNYSENPTELECSIQALYSLAWKFIEETERENVTALDRDTANNVSNLMTAINASLLALEQIDDPFGVSDNILNEIQSSVRFDLETLNNKDLSATEILDRLSDQIKTFTIIVNRQVARVTEQRIISVLRNTISTTLLYIKTLQQNSSKIKCVNIKSLEPLFSMVQPLENILCDIALNEEPQVDDVKPNLKLKQMLIPPISSIAFSLDNLNKELKNENLEDDLDLKDIYDRINDSANQFMALASEGTESNNLAECFISFTKPINDLCCYFRKIGRSTENIVSSDYGSDDKLLVDFETIFDELMMDIDTLINNVNVVRDSENNMNPLVSLLEPLQDIKIGFFQVNQVLLSNQTGSNISNEVINCFEHLSHQFVQLNNCIVNQSIVEETNKELPFESSIKMIQNILFNDAIDDLGVNGILFGSVMKPLLQLQNIIISKMASVESDLSFSEHTDTTDGVSQSLSLSFSNNAQTVFDKVNNSNLKLSSIESPLIDNIYKEDDEVHNLLQASTSKVTGDFTPNEKNKRNNLVIKKGFECDIEAAFKYEEPNIITSEEEHQNSGFEVLFDETDLETASDFIEDEYLNTYNSTLQDSNNELLNLHTSKENINPSENTEHIPEHVLELFDLSEKHDLILNPPVNLFEELQTTLKNVSELTLDLTKETNSLDNDPRKTNNFLNNVSEHIKELDGEPKNLLNKSLENNIISDSASNICCSSSELNMSSNGKNSSKSNQEGTVDETETKQELKILNTDEIDQCSEINDKVDTSDSGKTISNTTIITNIDDSTKDNISQKQNIVENNESSNFKNPKETSDLVKLDNLKIKISVENNSNSSNTLNFLQDHKVSEESIIEFLDVLSPNEVTENVETEIVGHLQSSNNLIINKAEIVDIMSHKDTNVIENIEQPLVVDNEIHNLYGQAKHSIIDKNDPTKNMEIKSQHLETSVENQISTKIDEPQLINDKCPTEQIIIEDKEIDVRKANSLVTFGDVDYSPNETIITDETLKPTKDFINYENDLQLRTLTEGVNSLEEMDSNNGLEHKPFSKSNEKQNNLSDNNNIEETPESIYEHCQILSNTNDFTVNQNTDSLIVLQTEVMENPNLPGSKNIIDKNNLSTLNDIEDISTLKSCDEILNDSKIMNNEVLTLIIDSDMIDGHLKLRDNDISNEVKENQETKSKSEENIGLKEENNMVTDVLIESKNNKMCDFEPTSEIVFNKKGSSTDEINYEQSESKLPENVDKASVKVFSETNENSKQANVLENSNEIIENVCELVPTALTGPIEIVSEPIILNEMNNALNNNEVITAESIELMNPWEFDKNEAITKYAESINHENVIENEKMTLENSDGIKISLELSESKECPKYSITEVAGFDKEQSLFDNEKLKTNIKTQSSDILTDIIIEPQTVLTSMEENSVNNTKLLGKIDGGLENNKEKRKQEIQNDFGFQEVKSLEIFDGKEKDSVSQKDAYVDIEQSVRKSSKKEQLNTKDLTFNDNKNEESSILLCENIGTNVPKLTEEKSNVIRNEILDVCEKSKEENITFSDNIEENMILESEVPCENSIKIIENKICNKNLTESETTMNITENGDILGDLHFAETSNLSNSNKFDNIENHSVNNKCLNSVKEKTPIKNTDLVTTDYTQKISLGNAEENYVNQNKDVYENKTAIITEHSKNIDSLENNLSENNFKKPLFDMKESRINEEIYEYDKLSTFDINTNNPIEQQSQVEIEECKAVLNEEIMVFDTTQTLRAFDMKIENANEKRIEDVVNTIDIIENNTLQLPSIIDDYTEKSQDCEIITDKMKVEFTECNLNGAVNVFHDENRNIQENINVEKLTDTKNKITETKSECLPIDKSANIELVKTSIDNLAKETSHEIHDANKTFIPNNSHLGETYEQVKIESENEIMVNSLESELNKKAKQQIDVIVSEKSSNMQDAIVPEEEINDLPVKETISTFSIKPKSHCVEQIAVNKAECIVLENVKTLKKNCNSNTEKAQIKHELNVAAIGNIIIDYDSVIENALNECNNKTAIENLSVENVGEHTNEIVLKNIDIFVAPDECSMNEKKPDKTLNKLIDNSISLKDYSLHERNQNSDQLRLESVQPPHIIKSASDILSAQLNLNKYLEDGINVKLDELINEENKIAESSVTSTDITDTLKYSANICNIESILNTDKNHDQDKNNKDKKEEIAYETNDIDNIKKQLSPKTKESIFPDTSKSENLGEKKINELGKINTDIFGENPNKKIENIKQNETNVEPESIIENKNIKTSPLTNHNEKIIEENEKTHLGADEYGNNNTNIVVQKVKSITDEETCEKKRGSKKNKSSPQSQNKKPLSLGKSIEIDKNDTKHNQLVKEEVKVTDDETLLKTTDFSGNLDKVLREEIIDEQTIKQNINKTKAVDNEFKLNNDNIKTNEQAEIKIDENNEKSQTDLKITDKNNDFNKNDNKKRGSKKNKTKLNPNDEKSPSPDKSTKKNDENDDISQKIKLKTKNITDIADDKTSLKTYLSNELKNESQDEINDKQNTKQNNDKTKSDDVEPDLDNSNEKSSYDQKTNTMNENIEKIKTESKILDKDKHFNENYNKKRGSKKNNTSTNLQLNDEKSPSPHKLVEDSDVNQQIELKVTDDKTSFQTELSSEPETNLYEEIKDDSLSKLSAKNTEINSVEIQEKKELQLVDDDKKVLEKYEIDQERKKKKMSPQPQNEKLKLLENSIETNKSSSEPEKESESFVNANNDKSTSNEKLFENLKTETNFTGQNKIQTSEINETSKNELKTSDKDQNFGEKNKRDRGSKKKKNDSKLGKRKSPSPENVAQIDDKSTVKVKDIPSAEATKQTANSSRTESSLENKTTNALADQKTRRKSSKYNKLIEVQLKCFEENTQSDNNKEVFQSTCDDNQAPLSSNIPETIKSRGTVKSNELNAPDDQSTRLSHKTIGLSETESLASITNENHVIECKKRDWSRERGIPNSRLANRELEHRWINKQEFSDHTTHETNIKSLRPPVIIEPNTSEELQLTRRRDYDLALSISRNHLNVANAYFRPTLPLTYRSLTPERKLVDSVRYSCCSDRETERNYRRSLSPYPVESKRLDTDSIYLRNHSPSPVYRCPSETTLRCYGRPDNDISSYSRYSTKRWRGSDSFLHYSSTHGSIKNYSSWKFASDRWLIEDLNETKEAFKRLYFCVRLIDQTVSSGTRVKFWCSIIGYPEPQVQWYRDGQKLFSFSHNSSTRYQTKYANGLAQLIVDNAQSCDSGEYTCVATNSRDRISTTGFLTVYTSPSVFGVTRRPFHHPSLSVDRNFKPSSHDRLFLWSSDDLLRRNATKFNSDWCSSYGWGASSKHPKFVTSIIADDVATCGGTIALQVRLQGFPSPNVTWLRESKPLPRVSSKYVYLDDDGGLYTLLVKDSTSRDGGTYVCRACNLYGTADAEKTIRVVSQQDCSEKRGVKPAIIVSRPNDRLNVAVGEDITVTLRVAGEPKPKVIWMRGSRDVTFHDRSLKETVNDYVKLSIKKAQLSDAGTYFIIAKNVYGSDRAFVTVGVRHRARSLTPPRIRNAIAGRWPEALGTHENHEVPGPVRSVPIVTDRANNRIKLSWEKPETPVTVLVYHVEAKSIEEECWRQVGMTPANYIDLYNLKPGGRYKFRVTARNRYGCGQPVDTVDYVDILEPKYLPYFHQQLPGETKILLHHSATLQCHVRGVPRPRVTWFKDGDPLRAQTGQHEVGRTDSGKCTLTILGATDADGGRYACEAANDQGRVCTFTVVEVMANRRLVEAERRLQWCLMKNNNFKESEPVFTKKLINRRVEINSTVRLTCQVVGVPVPVIVWYKDGQPLEFSGAEKSSGRDSDDFSTLELTGVKYDDSGAYAAVASNPIGTASTRCVLEVINKNRTDPAMPEFVFALPSAREAADSIILNAQIDAYRPAKVEWFRDGIPLRNGRRVDIITDHDGNLELRIACVTKRDSGTYTLKVSNDTGVVESHCDVHVVDSKHKDTGSEQISLANHLYSKKPKFVVKPKFQEVEEGQEVVIDSEIVGDPLPKITWLRDGLKPEYYRDNSEFACVADGNRHQLKISHAKLTHTGTYTLLAENPHGQIKALISLQVYSTGHCKKKVMENGTDHATVERLPRISRGLVDIECRENDTVAFECQLNITQETDVRWKKDGKLVRFTKEIRSELINGVTARLEISSVTPLHEGLYTCTAFNELGEDSTSARLSLSSSPEIKSAAPLNGQRKSMLGSPKLAGEPQNDRSSKRLKRSSAPKFYAVLHDKMADVGETVRFQCSVSGHPPPWSSWEKDGRPIGVNSRVKVREDDDHRSMEICDVTPDDAGIYRITVENKYGKIQATARLEVLPHRQTGDVQITSSTNGRRLSGSTVCAGENFTLSCDIRGNSMSDVTWYKNDEEVVPGGRLTSNRDELTARLSISNLKLADTGVYTCVLSSESGVTRCSAELSVFDAKLAKDSYLQPPIFVQGLVPKRTVVEGELVELTVKLQGAVPMSAKWLKDDAPVPDCGDFAYVRGDDGKFGLLIADPFSTDSGTYSCRVLNSFGEAVSRGTLIVKELSSGEPPWPPQEMDVATELDGVLNAQEKTAAVVPRDDGSTSGAAAELAATILWGPCDTTVLRGARVVLETSYAGNPEPRVQWLRAGKTLNSDGRVSIANVDGMSSLTIDSITADDCGKYVVRVDNGLGNDYHFASVAVEGPPDPPAGRPAVAVSETSADVTWSSPAYDGGCMVTGYSVEVRPFNQTEWRLVADKCHSLSHIVRGLAPGESYVFRVRAENMHGSSDASSESVPVYILQTDYGNTVSPKKVNIENGELFNQRYEKLDELGKGRFGIVYKVKERESGKYYAAKFVKCKKAKDKDKAQEEVDIMNCLRHPKLLQLDAAFDYPREVIMVTEYISGGELFERVVADDFTLTEKDCILFTRQICEGVDYMHKQNIVHLDLKPENIMCQSRTSHQIKLIDFGLAQMIQPGEPLRVLFGTPEFVPPEIIGYEPIGLESDMWSVGVICYVLLSGLSPFMGDDDAETFTNITKAEFDFDDEAFDAISQDSKDFISALLIKRKEKRLTAKECLRHKWLAQQDMDMSCVILSTDKLRNYISRRKWQRIRHAMRALGIMSSLSAASRRVGGGGGGGSGVFPRRSPSPSEEEESAGESPPPPHESGRSSVTVAATATERPRVAAAAATKTDGGRRSFDARSDSGFSDCSSLASSSHAVRPRADKPSAIAEESAPAASRPHRSPRPDGGNAAKTATATAKTAAAPSAAAHATTVLPSGAGGVFEANRLIFDNGGRRSEADGKGAQQQRKEPIRIQRGDNFKKAVAFWKQ